MKKAKKKGKKKITALIVKTKTGFSAQADSLPVTATGKTITEIDSNMMKALSPHVKKGKMKHKNLVLEIDIKEFFQHYKVLNAKFLAGMIGMNPTLLSQYVQGRKHPSAQQTAKIMDGIQQIGKELSGLRLVVK